MKQPKYMELTPITQAEAMQALEENPDTCLLYCQCDESREKSRAIGVPGLFICTVCGQTLVSWRERARR